MCFGVVLRVTSREVFGPLGNRKQQKNSTHLPAWRGVLPPVLCAPFDEEDDWDDVAAGVPVLYGLRPGGEV